MKTYKLKIKTKHQTYNLILGKNLMINLSKILKNNFIFFEKCLLVIDKKVPKSILNKITFNLKKNKKIIYFFNSSEINKNQKTVNQLLNILLKNNFHRDDCIISIGGGITGDVSGFVASIFKRGIKFVNIPTTLLAQADASIGGKTGINSNFGKNLIGTFAQPNLVISDTSFLNSLPNREVICGYAEILKHSLILNKKLFIYLNKNGNQILKLKSPFINQAIYKSCLIKKKIIEKDENETNVRKILNFGHTFGHAYEATMSYSKKLNHGEAVLLGIISASNFAYQNSYMDSKNYKKIINHFNKFNLPRNISAFFSRKDINKILSFMQKDKKNKNEKINLILLKKISKVDCNKLFEKNEIYKFFNKELIN